MCWPLVLIGVLACGRVDPSPAPSTLPGGTVPCRGDGALVAVADPQGLWTSCVAADSPPTGALARLDIDPPRATVVPFPPDLPLGHVVALARGDGVLGVVWQVRDAGGLAAARVTTRVEDAARIGSQPVSGVIGAWIADGTLRVATQTGGATAVVTPGGTEIGCAMDGIPVAVWPDGAGLRLLIVSGTRAFTCLSAADGAPGESLPVEVAGFRGLGALDRSVAGLVHLADAGIADSVLRGDGTVDPLVAPPDATAQPPVHQWRDGRLVRVARWFEGGGIWIDDGGVRTTLALDGDGRVTVDGRPVVDAKAATIDLANAILVPVDRRPRTFLTTTGLSFTDVTAD